jgi:hypothetical protein
MAEAPQLLPNRNGLPLTTALVKAWAMAASPDVKVAVCASELCYRNQGRFVPA